MGINRVFWITSSIWTMKDELYEDLINTDCFADIRDSFDTIRENRWQGTEEVAVAASNIIGRVNSDPHTCIEGFRAALNSSRTLEPESIELNNKTLDAWLQEILTNDGDTDNGNSKSDSRPLECDGIQEVSSEDNGQEQGAVQSGSETDIVPAADSRPDIPDWLKRLSGSIS